MKKNLNIAYLNGAEGLIRRGAASGGGGNSGGSGSGDSSNIEYLDMSDKNIDPQFKIALLVMSNNIKIYNIDANPSVYISPYSYINYFNGHIPDHIANMAIACEVDFSRTVVINPNGTYIVEDWIKIYNLQELLNSVPRITKEEFYNLEA